MTLDSLAQEIDLAAAANIHWVFLRYPAPNSLNNAFDLYQAHPDKLRIDWCLMRQANDLGSTGNYAAQVAETVAMMGQENYKRVLSGRPLLYIYLSGDATLVNHWDGNAANLGQAIASIRSQSIMAGYGDPYIVLCTNTPSYVGTTGCDALSSYSTLTGARPGATYAQLDALAKSHWATQLSRGYKVVPTAMCGWNTAPRNERQVSWQGNTKKVQLGVSCVHQLPTNAELVSHMTAARQFVLDNPAVCDAQTVLIYAWNEYDEGGWLAPTLGDPAGSRAQALAAASLFTR